MELLRRMMALQHERGAVDDDCLRALSVETGVPLYRLEGLRSFYPVFRRHPGPPNTVRVCRDVVCRMRGGADQVDRVRAALADRDDVVVEPASCLGLCDAAPACTLNDLPATGSPEALRTLVAGRAPQSPTPATGDPWPTDPYPEFGVPFDVAAARLATGTADGADDAAAEAVIATLKAANLRGLGGAAFPTSMKWGFTRRAAGSPKTVICNADESEPGTFKDRAILEQLPHLVIEGMLLGGWVIGARRGIIYLRHEYQAARVALEAAIAEARARGALGENVFDSGFSFDIEIFVSPGGYILGEETALLEALEDGRGEPRNKPPFPTNAGLHGRPTLINNVETFAAVPVLLARGADWWSEQGAPGFAGLKYVSVSGDVERPGVYCVPWGTPMAEILERAGGVLEGRALKAFSPGGASTPFLPASLLDTPLDFDTLREAGSALGTGAIVFVAEHRDLLDVALAQVRFFRNESCGKCVPCRVGSQKAVTMVEAARGQGRDDLTSALAQLERTLARTSICGLGQVALLPLTSALAQFPEEASLQMLRRRTS
jgi:NADH:ubiquinone oxidoreductase subunit F (NADH-binding)/NADH:ubiquinone oxidoreductase subunit E